MNSKKPEAEKNAMTGNLYMMHGLRTVFHQLRQKQAKQGCYLKRTLFTIY